MLRSFNYTGRTRINQEDIPIALVGEGPFKSFEANLAALSEYKLPPEARLFVEAYDPPAYMRFAFGTVGNITPPPEQERILTEFVGSDAVRFRVKVVEAGTGATILAEADGVLPLSSEENYQNKLPLLPVRSAQLGQEVWRIEFPEGPLDRPVLSVNVNAGDRIAIVRSRAFMTLAWPAVLREILSTVLLLEKHSDLDDPSDWRTRWLQFGRSFLPAAQVPPHETDLARGWINDVVDAFCNKATLLAKFKEEGEES
jgi:hypothetical protein